MDRVIRASTNITHVVMGIALIIGLILPILMLAGCTDYGYRLNEAYGLNCRPEALQGGRCVATREAKQ